MACKNTKPKTSKKTTDMTTGKHCVRDYIGQEEHKQASE